MLANRVLGRSAVSALRRLLIDKTVNGPTTVYAGAGDTYANGRKTVKLSNDWIVAVETYNTYRAQLFVSKDKGVNFAPLCNIEHATTSTYAHYGWSMVSQGTTVWVLYLTTDNVRITKFDATTVANVRLDNTAQIDTLNASLDSCSLVIDSNGTLHAAWIGKRTTTYTTQFNIRYSKSIDLGATWSAPTQVTSHTATYNHYNINMVMRANGTPIMFFKLTGPSYFYIGHYEYDGASWVQGGTSYVISSLYDKNRPSATVDSKGVIWVGWDELDAASANSWNVCTSFSTDNGVTWSVPVKHTANTGGTNHMYYASIASNYKDEVVLVWCGAEASMNNRNNIYSRKFSAGSWGNINRLTYQVTAGLNENYPQTCDNNKLWEEMPPMIWTSSGSSKILFLGAFNEDPAIYHQTGSVVVGVAHNTVGSNRPLRLDNGWIIEGAQNTTDFKFYMNVSKDNGATWAPLCFINTASRTLYYSVATFGFNVTVLIQDTVVNTNSAYSVTFNALTVQNIDQWSLYKIVDTGQTAANSCSLTVAPNGDLHGVSSTKNATYPNAFNLRYFKSTNGGASWASAVQLTTSSAASRDNVNPCIVMKSNGLPLILFSNSPDGAAPWKMQCADFTTVWTIRDFYPGTSTWAQDNACATVDSNGTIHVVWISTESNANPIVGNVRYTYSTDQSLTWATSVKVTTETTHAYNQGPPSITYDANNKIHIGFAGYTAAISGAIQVKSATNKSGSWVVTNHTALASGVNCANVQVCDNFHAFDEPLMIYQDTVAGNIKFRGKWQGAYTRFDRGRGVVVDAAYDVSGNGGRKIVRLSNSWIVIATAGVSPLNSNKTVLIYVSKNNGATFSRLCWREYDISSGLDISGKFAIASIGTSVNLTYVSGTGGIYSASFDATTIADADMIGLQKTIDSGQTAMGSCSTAISANGDLYAFWASKNATYPNSFNIRYSKSTTFGASWGGVEYLSTSNTVGADNKNPSAVIRQDGTPFVVFDYAYSTEKSIQMQYQTAGVWRVGGGYTLYNAGTTHAQAYPSVTVDSTGAIIVTWHGKDATDATYWNIRVTKSTDNGVSFPAPTKLTTGNTWSQTFPVVAVDLLNDIYIMWCGGIATDSYYNIRMIKCISGTWGAVQNITNTTVNQYYPSVCDNYRDFVEPICIWQDNQNASVKARGKWYEEVAA